jgi:hypothetical protein
VVQVENTVIEVGKGKSAVHYFLQQEDKECNGRACCLAYQRLPSIEKQQKDIAMQDAY